MLFIAESVRTRAAHADGEGDQDDGEGGDGGGVRHLVVGAADLEHVVDAEAVVVLVFGGGVVALEVPVDGGAAVACEG